MVVADRDISLQVSGNGDVLEPHDDIIGKFPYICLSYLAMQQPKLPN